MIGGEVVSTAISRPAARPEPAQAGTASRSICPSARSRCPARRYVSAASPPNRQAFPHRCRRSHALLKPSSMDHHGLDEPILRREKPVGMAPLARCSPVLRTAAASPPVVAASARERVRTPGRSVDDGSLRRSPLDRAHAAVAKGATIIAERRVNGSRRRLSASARRVSQSSDTRS